MGQALTIEAESIGLYNSSRSKETCNAERAVVVNHKQPKNRSNRCATPAYRSESHTPTVTRDAFAEFPTYTVYQITIEKPLTHVGLVSLGLTTRTLSIPLEALPRRSGQSTGAVVVSIEPGSLAQEADLKPNDVVCRIAPSNDERPLVIPHGTTQDFAAYLLLLQPKLVFSFFVARGRAANVTTDRVGTEAATHASTERNLYLETGASEYPTRLDVDTIEAPSNLDEAWTDPNCQHGRRQGSESVTQAILGRTGHSDGTSVNQENLIAKRKRRHDRIYQKRSRRDSAADDADIEAEADCSSPICGRTTMVIESDLNESPLDESPPLQTVPNSTRTAQRPVADHATTPSTPSPPNKANPSSLERNGKADNHNQSPLQPELEGTLIDSPSENDVILGVSRTKHHGNAAYHTILLSFMDSYRRAEHGKKGSVSQLVVDEVRNRGGRFVNQLSDGRFHVVSTTRALQLAEQALWNRAPSIDSIRKFPTRQKVESGSQIPTHIEPTEPMESTFPPTPSRPRSQSARLQSSDDELEHQRTLRPECDVSDDALIEAPNDVDVIIGHHPTHPGNAAYHTIIASYLESFPKDSAERKVVGQKVVDTIRKRGGRFVKLMPDGCFHVVSGPEACKIALKALRNKCSESSRNLSALHSELELAVIDSPTELDVILKVRATNHPGNATYHQIIASHIGSYNQATRGKKHEVAQLVVDEVDKRGGRFVSPRDDGRFHVVSETKALHVANKALMNKSHHLARLALRQKAESA